MILIINTNSHHCKLYHYEKSHSKLHFIKALDNPDARKRSGELTSDREGHYKAGQSGRGTYSPRTDAKEVEIMNFSKEIANELNEMRNANQFEQMILIAAPHMLGLISQALDKHVKEKMVKQIEKDIAYMKDHELLDFLKKNTQYPD